MLIKRRKGWEIPERLATPESVYLNRRQILAASGFGLAAAALPGIALRGDRPDRRPLSGAAQQQVHDRTAGDAGSDQHQLQQLLRIRHPQEHRQRRRGAADPAVGGQDRRPGREGADLRHRRSHPQDAARGAALSPSLRRGLVDDGAVDRLPARRPGRSSPSRSATRPISAWRPS